MVQPTPSRRIASRGHAAGAALAAVALAAAPAHAASFSVEHPRVEFRVDPVGIDKQDVRLSWELASSRRGAKQAAYQVLVARDRARLAPGKTDVWDSGKVDADATSNVRYAGPALRAGERVYWRVRVTDDKGAIADGPVASWTMAQMDPMGWRAKFIGLDAAPSKFEAPLHTASIKWIGVPGDKASYTTHAAERFHLRRFDLPPSPVRRAYVTITAADQFILRVNGGTAGGARDKTRIERIDVKALLRPGKNVLTVQNRFRNGGPGAFMAQLFVELESGEQVVLSTDKTWLCSATRAQDWLDPDFEPRGWVPAQEVSAWDAGHGKGLTLAKIYDQVSTPVAYLRKPFEIEKPIARALLHATALGVYEARLSGKRAGDFVLAPGWTDYNKRLLYQTYDVTPLVRRGDNVFAALVGEGWYAGKIGWLPSNHGTYGADPPKFFAQLEVEHPDGTRTVVVTDESWKASTGAIELSDMMDGETYDARLEPRGWDAPRFDDGKWRAAAVYEKERRILAADPGPPVRVIMDLPARKLTQPRPGVYIYDLGQNLVGWVRLRVRGPAGAQVRLRFAEMLAADGGLYTEAIRAAKATDVYTLAGRGEELWEPRFTFHGFRYVEVTGYPGKPTLGSIVGRVVHSDTPKTASLVTSNRMLNQLFHNIEWGQRGNFLSVPTDCPQRDERLGWMGDAQIFIGTACRMMDTAAFFTKWMDDVVDAQSPEGAFADVVPRLGAFNDGAPAWGDAGVIVPWELYRCYADRAQLETHYAAMAKWVDYLQRTNPELLWKNKRGNDYGDWLSIDAETDKELLATAYFAQSTRLLSQIAEVLGKPREEWRKYRRLFASIKEAFNKAYVGADGRIKSDTQTAYLLALRFDLLPEDKRPLAVQHLVADLEKRNVHLSTGFLGVGHLLPGLTENGRPDLAYRLLLNDTFPSWGYSIKHGATTMWERWDGWTHDKGFQTPAMNSFNHYAFGSVGEWMLRHIAGIDADAPGYAEVAIAPKPGGGLTFARAEQKTIRGAVRTDWSLQGKTFRLKVRVPMNVKARVTLPFPGGHKEGGRPIAQIADVKPTGSAEAPVYEIGGGEYVFEATAP